MIPNLYSSISPGSIYQGQNTNSYRNQMVGKFAGYDLNQAMGQYGRRGASRSASTAAAAMPDVANARANAANAYAGIPFEDAAANAQYNLRGQVGREGEAQGWAGAGIGQQELGNSYMNQNFTQMGSLLRALGLF